MLEIAICPLIDYEGYLFFDNFLDIDNLCIALFVEQLLHFVFDGRVRRIRQFKKLVQFIKKKLMCTILVLFFLILNN